MIITSRAFGELHIRWLRLAAVAVMVWYFISVAIAPFEYSIIGTFNLLMHEAGHFIFAPLGQFMSILAGSLMQLWVPLVFLVHFWRQFQPIGLTFCIMWLGQNLIEVATYAGDAIAMQLPLLGGDAVIHDWNWLLTRTGLLEYTGLISWTLWLLGWALILFAGAYGFKRGVLPDNKVKPIRIGR